MQPVYDKPVSAEDIRKSIQSGDYFKHAHDWYTTKYMSILSERFFFIILTFISGLTLLVSISAVSRLMPINQPVPFIYTSRDIDVELPVMKNLRLDESESVNFALQRFYVSEYVKNRENYRLDKLQAQFRMIQKHSDPATFNVYRRFIDPSNPRSPIALYQRKSVKEVTINQVTITPDATPGRYSANALFTARLKSFGSEATTRWQAQMVFQYTDLVVDQSVLEDQPLKVMPMAFTVLEYSSRQLR